MEGEQARVARASRIWVEGKHDAELVEKVWGDDLRHEGVVVLMLDGVDNLEEVMADFGPCPERRAGVLVDHLVAGSKESRIAQGVRDMPGGENVLVLGHPYVDVWQAVKPERVGLREWPRVPRGTDIKHAPWRPWAGRTPPRPISPGAGNASWRPYAPTRTSSRACWAAWRSSSTSSPPRARAEESPKNH